MTDTTTDTDTTGQALRDEADRLALAAKLATQAARDANAALDRAIAACVAHDAAQRRQAAR